MSSPLRIPGAVDDRWSNIPDACLCSAARMLSRYVSRPLERMLAGHGITVTEFQLMLILREAPARALRLGRRLRLDPGPIGRALARLEERGVVTRATPWRFADWSLASEGAMHLELLEPGWLDINDTLRRRLGPELPISLVRVVDNLPNALAREHEGWCDRRPAPPVERARSRRPPVEGAAAVPREPVSSRGRSASRVWHRARTRSCRPLRH
jgi:hypothetical protein